MLDIAEYPLDRLAAAVGTPFYLYDGARLRASAAQFASFAHRPGAAGRYAMKANSCWKILETAKEAGLWIDAVSGNEVLRARRAGFTGGSEPPVILLTSDVFRDNALEIVLRERVLPNLGSPGMLRELRKAGYRGPIGLRVNPGFGQGHVESCDTGGPSSKHGIWPDQLAAVKREARDAGFPVALLHAHVGTGPELKEFDTNARRLVDFLLELIPEFPDASAISLGGGIPHPYHAGRAPYALARLEPVITGAVERFSRAARRPIRVEIEPGRFLTAGGACLVARVHDVKETRSNEKGSGHTFVMVDAGFCDLIRPALYGSYHEIEIWGRPAGEAALEPCVVAGPLCESGDVFTRSSRELLRPRLLPRPDPGDLLVLHDTGAYGYAMSSNYLSLGRPAEVWWEEGSATLVGRRETLEDVIAVESNLPI